MAQFRTEPCSHCGALRRVIDGAWLRERRKEAGYSLREFARYVGVSAAYVCDIEKNRRHCSPEMRAVYEAIEPRWRQ